MKGHGDTILLSATDLTDLMRFVGCTHATRLDLDYLQGVEGLRPHAVFEDAVLLQRQGDAHEEAHLEDLKQNNDVIEIERGDLWQNAEETPCRRTCASARWISSRTRRPRSASSP